MSTIYNAVAGAATTVKEAVVGKDETAVQAENSGTEPKAGEEGHGTSATDPFDTGNLETPLRSPTSPNPIDSPSAAAHTDPHPTSATEPIAANAAPAEASGSSDAAATTTDATPAPASALADAAANVKADSSTTNTDPSGPKVGNAQIVEDTEAKKEETPAGEAGTGITSPAEAEKAIHADAKKVEAETTAAETAGAAVEKKEEAKGKAAETSEAAKEKAEEVKQKIAPSTPQKSTEVEASPSRADSTKSDKKKLSTRLKEKLHIGSKKSTP